MFFHLDNGLDCSIDVVASDVQYHNVCLLQFLKKASAQPVRLYQLRASFVSILSKTDAKIRRNLSVNPLEKKTFAALRNFFQRHVGA